MNLSETFSASEESASGIVFIVDDEMMVTSSLQTMLLLETSYAVYCFNTPSSALQEAERLRPEVVVSDFSMPEMDGIQFLQRIKALLPEATLILLTGYADKESAIAAINAVGIYRYIEKPWDNDDLKISIANGLERSRLIGDLKQSVTELTRARIALEQSNHILEAAVEARTHELHAAWQTLSSIVNNTADGILTLDAALRPTSINPAAERWLRGVEELRDADLLSLPIETLLKPSPGTPEARRADGLRTLFSQTIQHHTYEVMIGDIPLEAGIAPLRNEDEAVRAVNKGDLDEPSRLSASTQAVRDSDEALFREPSGFVVVLRDITARREIERLRDDFVSTLTHDLRTPLLAAIQTLGFFADGSLGELPSRQRELITMLIQSNQDMLSLVNVLLDVYKYEAGQQSLIMDRLSPWLLLEATCQELDSLARSRQQTLTLEVPERGQLPANVTAATLLVQGDKRELKRVFTNLIGNAIHYTPVGGCIRVRLSLEKPIETALLEQNTVDKLSMSSPAMVQISVCDNGRGIPVNDIVQLFQRFSQGTSRQRSSGSGLGLYLSRQIVEAHHGRIWVDSEVDKGSQFYVQLPLEQLGQVVPSVQLQAALPEA
jgi:signal transduction histidine kinase